MLLNVPAFSFPWSWPSAALGFALLFALCASVLGAVEDGRERRAPEATKAAALAELSAPGLPHAR
jgi:hypothetical protein